MFQYIYSGTAVDLANDWTLFLFVGSVGSRKVRMISGHCFFPVRTTLLCSCCFYDELIVESTVEYGRATADVANHRSAPVGYRVRLRAEEVYPTRQHRGWGDGGMGLAGNQSGQCQGEGECQGESQCEYTLSRALISRA